MNTTNHSQATVVETSKIANDKKWLNAFRKIATLEGLSMVILLMFSVLKRTVAPEWGALGVRYVGWAHGLLVVIYVYMLVICWQKYGWSFGKTLLYFVASLIPFAPFWVDRKLKEEAQSA